MSEAEELVVRPLAEWIVSCIKFKLVLSNEEWIDFGGLTAYIETFLGNGGIPIGASVRQKQVRALVYAKHKGLVDFDGDFGIANDYAMPDCHQIKLVSNTQTPIGAVEENVDAVVE